MENEAKLRVHGSCMLCKLNQTKNGCDIMNDIYQNGIKRYVFCTNFSY